LGRQLVQTVIVPAKTKTVFPATDNFSPLKNLKKCDFQAVTLTVIDDWFDSRQASTSKDNGRVLCLTKFVKSVLVLKQGDLLLVKGRCAAQTKKSVEYGIKMVFSANIVEPGIYQAECQCAAGEGYSVACKHAAALAYCIEHYARSGDSLELVPCTSTLQSWHRPQAPGRNLTPKTIDEILGKPPLATDPSTEGTGNDALMNSLIASCTSTPILLLRAVNGAAYQNDYNFMLDAPTEILMLEQVNFVTPHTATKIEKKTRRQAKSKIWKRERRTRLTASVGGDIVRTARTGSFAKGPALRQLSTKKIRSPAISWGKDKEEVAVKEYETMTGFKVQKHGLQVDLNSHFLAASPDGITEDGVLLEIKCPYSIRDEEPQKALCLKSAVSKNGLFTSYTLNKSHNYYIQCQLQMHVCQVRKLDFVIYTLKGLYIESISYDPDFCERVLFYLDLYYRKVFAPLVVLSMWEREKMLKRREKVF